jgi:hypothetical protein
VLGTQFRPTLLEDNQLQRGNQALLRWQSTILEFYPKLHLTADTPNLLRVAAHPPSQRSLEGEQSPIPA